MPQDEIINNGWFLVDHYDPLDGSIVQLIEVTPELDLRGHIASKDCDCFPRLEKNIEGIPLLIHNSFDGREERERNERGN